MDPRSSPSLIPRYNHCHCLVFSIASFPPNCPTPYALNSKPGLMGTLEQLPRMQCDAHAEILSTSIIPDYDKQQAGHKRHSSIEAPRSLQFHRPLAVAFDFHSLLTKHNYPPLPLPPSQTNMKHRFSVLGLGSAQRSPFQVPRLRECELLRAMTLNPSTLCSIVVCTQIFLSSPQQPSQNVLMLYIYIYILL